MSKRMMTIKKDSRSLVRVKVANDNDLVATIEIDSQEISCSILDFNFRSVRIFSPLFKDVENFEQLGQIKINYGQKVIGQCESPQIIRVTPEKHIILDLTQPDISRGIRSKERLYVKSTFRPQVLAIDPIRIGNLINFEIINFSFGGMLLSTSLSNRHVLRGYKFDTAQIILPGIGITSASFKVQHVREASGQMRLGVTFENISDAARENLAQFALFGTVPPAEEKIEQKYLDVKSSVGPIKRLGSSIRVDIISTPADYHNTLRIRYEAYKSAKKIEDETTLEDMADEYDSHAIILAAKVDGAVVGTVRLVECANLATKFPFEEYFNFSILDHESRRNLYYEVSRLAVDPKFQGTDIIVKLFKEVARITCIKPEMTTICLSTKALRPMYKRLGLKVISSDVPHSVVTDETLALMRVDSKEFLLGTKMSAHAWDRVAKDVYENLKYAEITNLAPSRTKINFMLKIEKLLLGLTKNIKKKNKK